MNNVIRKLIKFYYILHPKKIMEGIFGNNIPQYDEIYFWNSDFFTESIRSYYAMQGKNLKCFIFEEGYISYFPFEDIAINGNDIKLIKFRNKLAKIPHLVREKIDGLIVFEPSLLLAKPACPVYTIDRKIGDNKEFREIIDKIFNAKEVSKKYDKKYIIFEENRPEIDDEKLFDKIIDIVGKDNVIIKLHPVRKEDRFSKKDVKTLGSDGVPWEAIAFAGNFSDKVLIAIGSGSVTSYRILFGNNMKAFLMFKFLNSNIKQFDNKYQEFWDNLEAKDDKGGIYMPRTEEAFYQILEKEKESDDK